MKRRNGRGLLTAMIDMKAEHVREFTQWYETEHLPDRQRCPGFLTAKRYVNVEGAPREFLGLYDLASPEVRDTADYKRIATTPWTAWIRGHFPRPSIRNFYREVGPQESGEEPKDLSRTETRALVLFWADVEPARDLAFQAWLETDHFLVADGCPGMLSARAFVNVEGDGSRWMVLHELENLDVLTSSRYRELSSFPEKAQRYVYKEICPKV